jgi:hypothetical protein
MKRFFKNALLFAVIVLLIISAVVYPLSLEFERRAFGCKAIAPYCRVNMIYDTKGNDAKLIIMGNSRASGYDDSILSDTLGIKCFNIGFAGYPFIYQYHIMYKTYMSQNARPDYIIQEIGPWAFFDYVMPKYSIDMCPYIDRENFSFLKEITPELSYADNFRLVRYAGKLQKVINEFNNIDESRETNPLGQSFGQTFHRSGLINGKQKFERTPENILQFKQFIDECTANNIRLILVCSPILKEVSSTYFEMDRFWNLIDSINHDSRLTVLNYQDLFGNDTTMFMDYIHLNARGTEEFSAIVGHDLKQILPPNHHF